MVSEVNNLRLLNVLGIYVQLRFFWVLGKVSCKVIISV